MSDRVVFMHDAPVAGFSDVSATGVSTDDSKTTIEWDELPVVTVDAPADLERAFDTNRFVKIEDVTIARPIKQPYQTADGIVTYQKPADELRAAAWSFDNTAFTLSHPSTGMVKDVRDVHGFWRNAHYDGDDERLLSDLYIPAEDDEAREFVSENQDVSVGFFNRVQAEYDGDTGALVEEQDDIDGYQTNLYGNHVAAVEHGRCSSEQGCGLDGHYGAAVMAVDGETTSYLSKELQTASEEGGDDEYEPEHEPKRVSLRDDELDLSIPEAAQNNAQAFLDAVDNGTVPESCGGEDDLGRRRARQFADGGELSLEVWVAGGTSAVANWHPRHEGDEEYDDDLDTPWKDCGYAMFKAWGGAAAREKSARLKAQHEEMKETQDMDTYNQGTMVSWQDGDARGEIIDSKTDGCFNERIDGDFEICGSEDEPAYLIEEDDGKTVAHKHGTLTVESSDGTLDAPMGVYTADDQMFAVAPDEHSDDSTEHADDAKYPVTTCADVDDAWKLRGQGDYSIEQSTLEERIMRVAESMDCDADALPNTLVKQMEDDFTIPDLSIDALAKQNEQVAELRAERDSHAKALDDLCETLGVSSDECPCDGAQALVDERDELAELIETVREELSLDEDADVAERVESIAEEWHEYRADKRQERLDRLAELNADVDAFEGASLDELDEEIERREDIVEAMDTTSPTGLNDSEPTTDENTDVHGRRRLERGYKAE